MQLLGCMILFCLAQAEERPLDPLKLVSADTSGLTLVVAPFDTVVVESAPLVLRIALENKGQTPVNTFFKEGRTMVDEDTFRLVATDTVGKQHELRRLITLTANRVRAAGIPLPPAAKLATDYVMCLHSTRDPDNPKMQGKGYFLAPGKYSVKGVLNCPPEIEAEPFELTVLEATGDDAKALELFEQLPYYAQGAARFPRPDAKRAEGGSPDEVRAALTRLETELPRSVFAKWTRYWTSYHALETNDPVEAREVIRAALVFADDHPSFPLTDNLLFRTAEQVRRVGENAEARRLLSRLRANYPDTDVPDTELKKLNNDIDEDKGTDLQRPGDK